MRDCCHSNNISHNHSHPNLAKLKAVESQQQEGSRADRYLAELDIVEKQITQAEIEKNRIWKAFELTGNQQKFSSEIKDVTDRIETFCIRKIEIDSLLEKSQKTEINIGGIKEFCKLASYNLANFTYGEKRLALEALGIKVFVNNQQVEIEGCIPEADLSIESTLL
ncbi:hypothetical protein ACFLVZ_01450 [Chloroflexota bacterium]